MLDDVVVTPAPPPPPVLSLHHVICQMATEPQSVAYTPTFFAFQGEAFWAALLACCSELELRPPAILTGVPSYKGSSKAAAKQKKQWCASRLQGPRGPSGASPVEVYTCRSNDKHKYSGPGCVLIDDHLGHAAAWKAAGGVFIHFTNAASALRQLRAYL